MNDSHDHTMGSTIRQYDPAAAASTASPNMTASPNATASLAGLDVSGWQSANLNWGQIYAQGGRFAYIKATESTGYKSGSFAAQYNGAYNAGLVRGAYHFAVPNVSSGATQANFFVDNGGGWSADGMTLPPLLDIEYDPYTATDGTNTCYGLSAAQMVGWIRDFSNTVLSRTGRLPAIYSTTNWWGQCTGNTSAFGANPLFIARYVSSTAYGPGTLPAGWGSYTMWQWADSGIFPGDQDVFNGDASALRALALNGSAVPAPAPAPVPNVAVSPAVIGAGDLNGDGKPDLVARKPDGTLWFYAGTGASASGAGYAAGVQVGSGWGQFDQIIGAGDINGDGRPDLLARRADGTLWFAAGLAPASVGGPARFANAVQLSGGWQIFSDIIAAGDVNGDGKPDLLGRKPDGTLWLYAGTGVVGGGSLGFQNGVQAGSAWNQFSQVVGIGDLDRDGRSDLLGMRPDGSLWLYRGSGSSYLPGVQVNAPGLSASDLLIAAGDANGDGYPDLLTRSTDGLLKFFGGASVVITQPPFGAAQQVGSGWGVFSHVVGAGDINSDGTPDIVAVKTDGSLWWYDGNGSSGGVNRSYQSGVKIGSGWGAFPTVINGGDFTGDGTNDLVGIRNDGTLWLYPATGTVSAANPNAYRSPYLIGTGWSIFTQIVAGDFNGDGLQDIVGTLPNGTMLLYPGVKGGSSTGTWFGQPAVVGGGGWNTLDGIASTGDANRDGHADVVVRDSSGALLYFEGNGAMSATNPGYAPSSVIGSGWNVFDSVTGTGDSAQGRGGDLLGIKPDGSLWYYPGTMGVQNTVAAMTSAIVAGSGWNIFG